MSPVANQPSPDPSAVASGRLRYSRNRFGPRTWISPTVSVVARRRRCAVVVDEPEVDAVGSGGPTEPGRDSPPARMAQFMSVSVMP